MGNKDHRRLKRKQKQQQLRRLKSVSPVRAVTRASGQFRCYATEGWREQGIASIAVVKTLPDGSPVLGAYLVDLWCLGLKDAWGRLDITTEEIEEWLARSGEHGAAMAEVDLHVVQQLVAGGIRFAQQNRFRLPHHYERWAKFIEVDPVKAMESADLSLFGMKEPGKKPLCYVGPVEDLNRRLIGMTAEEFLARPDVDFIVNAEDLFEDEDLVLEEEEDEASGDEQEWEDHRQAMQTVMLDRVRQWCFATGQVPHPALPEAIDTMMESLLHVRGEDPDAPEVVDESARLFDLALDMHGPQQREELEPAVDQLSRWVRTFDSPAKMLAAMGLPAEQE